MIDNKKIAVVVPCYKVKTMIDIPQSLINAYVKKVKDTAGKLLASTDWYVIRKAERNVEIPAEVSLKRTQIVTEANRLENDIQASTSVEGLIEVLNGQNWGE